MFSESIPTLLSWWGEMRKSRSQYICWWVKPERRLSCIFLPQICTQMDDSPRERELGDKAEITRHSAQSGEESGAAECYQSKHYGLCCAHPQASSTPLQVQGPGCVKVNFSECLYWTLNPVFSGNTQWEWMQLSCPGNREDWDNDDVPFMILCVV